MGSLTAYVDGGFILTLSHRHDIRVGIASGMYLRALVTDVRLRLEILCVLHLCYWRWSTRLLLQALCARIEDYVVMQPMARVELWRDVWRPMECEMEDKQVVSWPAMQRLELWTRDAVKLTRRAGEDTVHAHHPCMNPSSRRTGSKEFAMLMTSLADGSLWRACDDIAKEMSERPSYAGVLAAMKKHSVSLWEAGNYTCIRLRMIQLVRGNIWSAWSTSYRSSANMSAHIDIENTDGDNIYLGDILYTSVDVIMQRNGEHAILFVGHAESSCTGWHGGCSRLRALR